AVVLVEDPGPDGVAAVVVERAGRRGRAAGEGVGRAGQAAVRVAVGVVEAGRGVDRRDIGLIAKGDRRRAALIDRAVVGEGRRRGDIVDRDPMRIAHRCVAVVGAYRHSGRTGAIDELAHEAVIDGGRLELGGTICPACLRDYKA